MPAGPPPQWPHDIDHHCHHGHDGRPTQWAAPGRDLRTAPLRLYWSAERHNVLPVDDLVGPSLEVPLPRGGGILRKCKIPITGFYYGLLRFITDITEFYYGYYGIFLRIILTLKQDPKKAPETLIFEKTLEKASRFITDIMENYRYYGNRCYEILWNITVRNISPPPCFANYCLEK